MTKVQHTYAVRLMVEDGGRVKAELAVIGSSGQQSLALIEKGGENASQGLSRLTDRAAFLSKGLKSLAVMAAGAVSVGGLALMTKKAIDAAGALADTAVNLGINVEALQELRYAAEMSGVAQESFDKSLEKFTRNIGAAAQGSGAAKSAFDILGVSVRDTEGNMVDSMIADITRLIIRTQITGPLAESLGSFFGSFFGSADGNVFSSGRPVRGFARGGVVFQPTIFPMANGMGLMGEAGPEAIMPLQRLPSGRLGVEATGSGASNYTVNVDARGSTDPAATAQQVEDAVDRALTARIPGIIRTSTAAAKNQVIDTWQRRGGRFD